MSADQADRVKTEPAASFHSGTAQLSSEPRARPATSRNPCPVFRLSELKRTEVNGSEQRLLKPWRTAPGKTRRSSKPVRRRSPTLGRFDSCAAPSSRTRPFTPKFRRPPPTPELVLPSAQDRSGPPDPDKNWRAAGAHRSGRGPGERGFCTPCGVYGVPPPALKR